MKKKLPEEDPNEQESVPMYPESKPAAPAPEEEKPRTWKFFVMQPGQNDPKVGEVKEIEAGDLTQGQVVELYNDLIRYFNYMPGVVRDKFAQELLAREVGLTEEAMAMHPENQSKIILPNQN